MEVERWPVTGFGWRVSPDSGAKEARGSLERGFLLLIGYFLWIERVGLLQCSGKLKTFKIQI